MDLFLVLVCLVHVIVGPLVLINKQPRSYGFGGPRLFKTHSCYKWPSANGYGGPTVCPGMVSSQTQRLYSGPRVGLRWAHGGPTVGPG